MERIDYSMEFYGTYMWPQVEYNRYIDENHLMFIIGGKWRNREFDHAEANAIWFGTENNKSAFIKRPEGVAYLSNGHGEINVGVASDNLEDAQKLLDFIKSIAPEYEEKDDDKVEVEFWSLSERGPSSITRSLDVPTWDDIRINYSQNVRDELSKIMDKEWRPTVGGNLILWHGEPGTGKTTALRALAREWRDWCEMHYIADPERFFGTSANYMMNVMIEGAAQSDKWRLLILEDCGELISSDAKQVSGQGLSRLLNAVDGLIGQGLRFMVLITTNEEFKKLNNAVTRPGRCLLQLPFERLGPDEVLEWIKAHKVDESEIEIPSVATIAHLYAETQGFGNKPKEVGFGFSK